LYDLSAFVLYDLSAIVLYDLLQATAADYFLVIFIC
jgi:hypothetical protein